MEADKRTGISAFLTCLDCLNETEMPLLTVGASPHGDLVIWCERHNHSVARIPNSEVAATLLRVSGQCDCCGKKEVAH